MYYLPERFSTFPTGTLVSSELFSIITAVRNARETIGETLASIVGQTYPSKEFVVQDGGSQDGTLDVIRAAPPSLIKLDSAPDSGVYDAFNRGLRRASGSFITFIGADDRYEDEFVLERVAEAFQDRRVQMVFGDALIVKRDAPSRIVRRYDSGRFNNRSSLSSGFMPAHTALFVRRSLYDRVGEFDRSYRIAGDFQWLVRAFRDDPPPAFVHIPRPFTRMRSGGLSSSGLSSTWQVTREFYRACRTNGQATSYPRLLWRLAMKASEMSFLR